VAAVLQQLLLGASECLNSTINGSDGASKRHMQQPQQQTLTSSQHGIIMLSCTKIRTRIVLRTAAASTGHMVTTNGSLSAGTSAILGSFSTRISLFIRPNCCHYMGMATSSTIAPDFGKNRAPMYPLDDFYFSPLLLINFPILLMVTPLHSNTTTALQHYCNSLFHCACAASFSHCSH